MISSARHTPDGTALVIEVPARDGSQADRLHQAVIDPSPPAQRLQTRYLTRVGSRKTRRQKGGRNAGGTFDSGISQRCAIRCAATSDLPRRKKTQSLSTRNSTMASATAPKTIAGMNQGLRLT